MHLKGDGTSGLRPDILLRKSHTFCYDSACGNPHLFFPSISNFEISKNGMLLTKNDHACLFRSFLVLFAFHNTQLHINEIGEKVINMYKLDPICCP